MRWAKEDIPYSQGEEWQKHAVFGVGGSSAYKGFPTVQSRISSTKGAAGLVSLALVVNLVSCHVALNSFRAFSSGQFLQLGISDPPRILYPNVFLPTTL